MIIVRTWTGRESSALREAMQQSIDEFAAVLEVSPRTVDYWEAKGAAARLRPGSQRKLRALLGAADTSTTEVFEHLIGQVRTESTSDETDSTATLALEGPVQSALDIGDDQLWVTARNAGGEVVVVSLPRRQVMGIGLGAFAAAAVGPLGRAAKAAVAALANAPIDHVAYFAKERLRLIEEDNLLGSNYAMQGMEDNAALVQELQRAGIGPSGGMLRMQVLYAEGCAWLHQDSRAFDRSLWWSDRALEWSHAIHDDRSVSICLIRKAQIANDMGLGEIAVGLANEAARYAPLNSPLAATAATFAGYGYALHGDTVSSGDAFDKARTILARVDDDPYWGFFLDEQYINLHEAHALAALGRNKVAAGQFAAAIGVMQTGYPRDKGVYLGRQALAHMYAGEIEPAAKAGKQALAIGRSTGSARILHEVSRLQTMIDPRSKQTGVAEFHAARTIEP